MSVLVPNRNSSSVVMVRTMLMEDEVRINSTSNVIGSIRSRNDGPLHVGLMSMSVLVPDGDLSIIVGVTTM